MLHYDAENYLKSIDKRLGKLIERYGPCPLNSNSRNKFDVLVTSIIGQQLSMKAAQTIKNRICELLGKSKTIKAEHLLDIRISQLRACGLSRSKSEYILELAKKVAAGELKLTSLHKLPDTEVMRILVAQKGIGVWTAEMFMIFALGRLDILSTTDAGLLRSVQSLYKLKEKPGVDKFTQIAEKWRPYRSIASWYLWNMIDK